MNGIGSVIVWFCDLGPLTLRVADVILDEHEQPHLRYRIHETAAYPTPTHIGAQAKNGRLAAFL